MKEKTQKRNASQSRHQRRRKNRNLICIPRAVWDVFATQTAIMLQQALLIEKMVCSQRKQYLQNNR